MKPRYKAGGLITVVVLLGGVVAALAFIYLGSQLAVYSAIAIVPILVVVGALWVQSTVGAGSGEDQIARREARSVADMFEAFWEDYQQAKEALPDTMAEASLDVDRVISKLDSNAVAFDRDTGTASLRRLTLFSEPELESVSNIQMQIGELEEDLDGAVERGVKREIRQTTEALGQLNEIVTVSPPTPPNAISDDQGTRKMLKMLNEHERHIEGKLEDAATEIRRTLEETNGNGDVETKLEKATVAADKGKHSEAVEHLLEARRELQRVGDEQFSNRQRAVLEIVDTVREAPIPKAVGGSHLDRIDEIGGNVESFGDATDMPELRSRETELRSQCTDLVATLENERSDAVSTLEAVDVPEEYYSRIPDLDRRFASEVEEAGSLAAFRDTLQEALSVLADDLERIGPKADVARGYEAIAEQIDEELQRTGTVRPDDIPVREHEGEFMRLYALKNPSVRFDTDSPRLRLPEDTERYELTVAVTLEPGSDEQRIDVQTIGHHEESKSVTTADVAQVVFESVPYGEHTVEVIPSTEQLAADSRTVLIDGDESVSVTLSSLSPAERLCEDIDDPDKILADLEPRVSDRFEEVSYLETDMEFPIEDRYLGCLLARWGETNDKAVFVVGNRVFVYDHEQLLNELQRVVQHNLDDNEPLSFDELRGRYLTVEAPDGVLAEASEELDGAVADDGQIRAEGQ